MKNKAKTVTKEAISKATAKSVPMSPQKVGLVLDLIRKQNLEEARRRLKFTRKAKAAGLAIKVLNSAAANAKQKGANPEDLVVTRAVANSGPILKRWEPMPRGRVGEIRKRTTHITIELGISENKLDDEK